ncbi:MAG: nucleoside phosphorylase [Candidatus Riflebacteria bacterium]|nr:nucleoside phosphorylase [Candidatus Riflebacteria bacterium]
MAASDLPVANGKIYHLNIAPEQLASDIIIVGDPDRVTIIADEYLVTREHEAFHRGLRTITGTTREGLRVSVVTSGMGTPSLEIVLGEIVALNEIDFATMTRKPHHDKINIIRVGTSGGLQSQTRLGTPILTAYAVGLDNTGLFYDADYPDPGCLAIEKAIRQAIDGAVRSTRFKGTIHPYVSRADPAVVEAMEESARERHVTVKKGITVSSAGFFCNQGRDIARVPPSIPDVDAVLGSIGDLHEGLRVENMEMESSFLLHFMTALGYGAGAICPAIANRKQETFTASYVQNVKDATEVALAALMKLRR